MKILIVTHYFTPHIGGIEVVAYNQAKELAKNGNKVTIITSKMKGDKEDSTENGIRIVRVNAVNFLENTFGIPYPIFSPELIFLLKREIKNADVIHAHGAIYLGSFVSSLFASRYNKKFMVTEHVGFVNYKSLIANAIQKMAFLTIGKVTLNKSDRVFVLNKRVKYFLSKLTTTNIVQLGNGVDTNLFRPVNKKQKSLLREKYNLPQHKQLALFVGRFVEKKGIELLINAKDSSYDLVLAGSGKLSESFNTGGIYIFRSMSQELLAEIYQACDIFILPSKGEGFPLSIQEAMASGLPIITCKENLIVANDKKFASSIELSSADIKRATLKILNNKRVRESKASNARKIAVSEFSWLRHVSYLLQEYKS